MSVLTPWQGGGGLSFVLEPLLCGGGDISTTSGDGGGIPTTSGLGCLASSSLQKQEIIKLKHKLTLH